MSLNGNDEFLSDIQALMERRYGIKNPDAFVLVADECLTFIDPLFDSHNFKVVEDYKKVRGKQPKDMVLKKDTWTT